MEVKISNQQILKLLYLVSWILFIGLCIEAGGLLFNAIFTHWVNQPTAKHFWKTIDLSALYQANTSYFISITCLITIVALLKATLFYLIVKILHHKKLNLTHPFKEEVGRFIFHLSYLCLGIGLFAYWEIHFQEWLVRQGISIPSIQAMGTAGADVWLFMFVVLLVIAQIFKKGIAIQSENDLTV